MTDYVSVHITVSSRGEAEKIARALVQERLAACVNIISDVRSIYMWEGKHNESDEVLLIAKTGAPLFERLKKFVKTLHSHDCPCIVALPIVAGHQPYLDWVAQGINR